MRKTNILYVITKLELGGAQKQLLSLIRNLDKERFSIFLVTAQEGLLMDDFLSSEGLILRRSVYLERPINPIKDLLALFEIYRFIKENNIEMVHTHSSKAGIIGRFAAKLAKVKFIIHTVHGWSFNDFQPALSRIFFIWLERFTAGFTSRFIAVSNYDIDKGLRLGIGSPHKYKLIRYGIDYADFSQKDETIKEELGIKNGNLVVGMVSCLKPQKSPQDFIKLAGLVHRTWPRVKFVLVGDGVLRRRVEGLLKKSRLGENVILTGWRRDVCRMFSAMDIFVLTSLWEGLPIAALEAMSASLPVLATDTGGISEIVSDGKTGFLVKTKNIRDISTKLHLLLNDGDLRKGMGRCARSALGPEFTLLNMVKRTEDLYCNLLQNGQENSALWERKETVCSAKT